MSLILRRVEKPRWYKNSASSQSTRELSWLAVGETQGDALRDLQTASNALSVYSITDPAKQVERVAVALATTRHFFADFDYALVDAEAIRQLGIKVEPTNGGTPDAVVNGWHLDLVEMTVERLAKLAAVISERAQFHRIVQKKVEQLAIEAAKAQRVEIKMMPEKIQQKIMAKLSNGQ